MTERLASTTLPLYRPRSYSGRRLLAVGLRTASLVLVRLARQLTAAERMREPVAARAPMLEFYAEAGAQEGALYVDGKLFCYLPGVTRL
ncbi:MAG: hypothetical protein PHS32_01430 [Rhodoferax sp.]|uniref:hypothetical protein n=1 Tax=Rhodoferax sp. TaxID=50421 RepID=UPI00261C5A05|nr:hypothetical protein [Rhodoferax sp.]MDD5332379.1 hypothetical protein [Rhodoferax sp.]